MTTTTLPASMSVLQCRRVKLDYAGIVQYQMQINDSVFIVEMRSLFVISCSCHIMVCQHEKIAIHLEKDYQAQREAAREKPASCSLCGRMCRRVRGLAMCPNCAS